MVAPPVSVAVGDGNVVGDGFEVGACFDFASGVGVGLTCVVGGCVCVVGVSEGVLLVDTAALVGDLFEPLDVVLPRTISLSILTESLGGFETLSLVCLEIGSWFAASSLRKSPVRIKSEGILVASSAKPLLNFSMFTVPVT